MSYASEQYKNAVKYKESLQIEDEKNYTVTANGKPYHHIFKNTNLNLWEGIRENALTYFREKSIHWHKDEIEGNPETIPEGNMLSSQISCVNHLFGLRAPLNTHSPQSCIAFCRIFSAQMLNKTPFCLRFSPSICNKIQRNLACH
ncbi:MAG: hypothetical protein Ta2B_24590 [Termitinemataceae bacterium]|nr:MAG: hypothetical protein Ta2B_24590 [Termitinemataceae bacterium]